MALDGMRCFRSCNGGFRGFVGDVGRFFSGADEVSVMMSEGEVFVACIEE